MNKTDIKAVIYTGLGGIIALSAAAYLINIGYFTPKQKRLIPTITQPAPTIIQEPKQLEVKLVEDEPYVIKKGEFLSEIVCRELGLNGGDIYDKITELKKKNPWLNDSKRDIYKNGIEPGQDGFPDLIYPGEKLEIN